MKRLITALALFAGTATLVGCGSQTPPPPADAPERQPWLISEKDGVKLYGVRAYYNATNYNVVYFTTPAGDVQWKQTNGKTSVQKQTTSGTGQEK